MGFKHLPHAHWVPLVYPAEELPVHLIKLSTQCLFLDKFLYTLLNSKNIYVHHGQLVRAHYWICPLPHHPNQLVTISNTRWIAA